MILNKLEKEITLYKTQFDKFNLDIFGDHRLDRLSLDTDALLFRIRYMIKHHVYLSNKNNLKEEFTNSALKLRNTFSEFMHEFLIRIVKIPKGCKLEDIKDILAQDVKIDSIYVKFKMILLSENKEYLEYVDNIIPENEVFNIFPNEYFRYSTDSYNDAIAKAYPELFENRRQDKIGTGEDADVFCHNFTFQTSERCSLNCFVKGTKILMADLTYKNIEDIKLGDEVMGFQEHRRFGEKIKIASTLVTSPIMKRKRKIYKLSCDKAGDIFVTADHPMLTWDNRWVKVKDLTKNDTLLFARHVKGEIKLEVSQVISVEDINREEYVYNFETFKHTYIANGILTHNCTYCYQFNKTNMKMSFDIAKKFIDDLLSDKYGYINRYNSPAIIIEFIGGEPLLEINLTRKIYEYFLDRCYELNHPWFKLHRVSICSNGLQYFDDEVQSFFKEYSQNISFNISIDGNKQLHDSCRIQPNGEGSYDIDMMALNHFNKHYTSV